MPLAQDQVGIFFKLTFCCLLLQTDFFVTLHDMLKEVPDIVELHAVPDSHVPVMKFKLKGISIDLVYAKLNMWQIPEVSFLRQSCRSYSTASISFLRTHSLGNVLMVSLPSLFVVRLCYTLRRNLPNAFLRTCC